MLVFENFTACYLRLVEMLWERPEFEAFPRGLKVKENLCASFEIKNPRHRIPFVEGRDFSMGYMVAELLWYLSGNDSTAWISNYSSFWKNISDDGKTANSAYGARLLKNNPKIAQGRINQWEYVLDELTRDPDSRRAIMHIRVPDDSIDAKLDVPCTLALQFFIRDSKLHLVVNMRSSDVIFGLAYDVPAFTVLQEIMAMQLCVGLGSYRHVSNSLHLYERHFEMASRILEREATLKSLDIADAFGPMHPLDSFFASGADMEKKIGELFEFESIVRSCNTAVEVNDALEKANFHHESHMSDWAKSLAFHRIRKIDPSANNNTSFWYEGYSYGK